MAGPTKAAPKPLYYAVIDGTDFVDSAMFGADLEKNTAFRNIAEFIAPDSSDGARLVDPTRPDFSIWKVKGTGRTAVKDAKGVAVMAPAGLNGSAKDPSEDYSKVELAGRYISDWIFEPAVSVDAGKAVLGAGSGTVTRANLIAISSHGWLGGYCVGEIWGQQRWFIVGKAAYEGKGFKGPCWVILAQCSTLNSATWASWAQILMKSDPHVRGILGYEEVAPGATAATSIAKNFVAQLKKGVPFLDAWKANNTGNNWAAIVHKEALKDKLSDLPAIVEGKKSLADITTTDTLANYKGYLKSAKGVGQDIFIKSPPFTFSLRLGYGSRYFDAVEPWNLANQSAQLIVDSDKTSGGKKYDGLFYEVRLGLSGGSRIKKAKLEWIHIRASKVRLAMDKIFETPTATTPAKVTFTPKATWTFAFDAPAPDVTVQFPCQKEENMHSIMGNQSYHADDKLVPHHSYLWLRVTLTPETGADITADFPTHGLSWFGPPSGDPNYC